MKSASCSVASFIKKNQREEINGTFKRHRSTWGNHYCFRQGLDLKNLRQKNGEAVAQVLQLLSKELPMENFQTSYVSLYKDDYNKLNKYRVV